MGYSYMGKMKMQIGGWNRTDSDVLQRFFFLICANSTVLT